VRFPSLQEGMKGLLASEMEKVVREEKWVHSFFTLILMWLESPAVSNLFCWSWCYIKY
jgi:hypothetical protein